MLEKDVTRAVDALQLCSLLLPQSNRVRLHRTLRFINKASANERLRLSPDNSNQRVVRKPSNARYADLATMLL